MRRALVQAGEDGLPFNVNVNAYAAWVGFRERGLLPEPFRHDDPAFWEAAPAMEGAVFAAGIGTVLRVLDAWGVPRPSSIDYPVSLAPWLGRRVGRTTLGEARDLEGPLFVKSVGGKVLDGHLLENGLRSAGYPDETPVYVSEPVRFRSEWRVFVAEGELLGVRPYKGSPYLPPDERTVRAMLAAFLASGEAPAAFGMDVGVVEGKGTLLVEVNEGFSLGTYGLAPPLVARMLEARWAEFERTAARPSGSG